MAFRPKLDEGRAAELRRRWGEGDSAAALAAEFGLSPAGVWNYCERRGREPDRKSRAEEAKESRARAAAKEATRARADARKRRARAAKAKESERDEALRLWSEGWPGKAIAVRLGIARSKVSALVAGLPRERRGSGPVACPTPVAIPPAPARRVALVARVVATPADPRDICDRAPTSLRGSEHGRARVDEAMVVEMRRLRRVAGWSTGRLARRFGLARNSVCYALAGVTWSHVPGAIPAKGRNS